MIRKGEYEAALMEFNQAIRTNPRYAKAYSDRGVAYSKLNKLDEAVQDFSKAIELAPQDVQALANRANAYQLMHRHQEALSDYTDAVAIDKKYAAVYSLTRGMVEAVQGNFRQAIADYAVALVIDPKNRSARVARADAQEKLDSHFEVSQSLVAPAAETQLAERVTDSSAVIDLGAAVLEAEEEAAEPIAGTQIAKRAGRAQDTHLAITVDEDQSPEDAAYAEEQRKFAEQERQKRMQALEEKAAEIRKRNELEEAKRKAQAEKDGKWKKKAKRDPDEVRETWRKRKQYAILAVASLFLGYWAWQLVWAIIPPSKNPYPELEAQKLAAAFAKDPTAANERFANKVIVVRGKLRIVRPEVVRGRPPLAPKIYFEIPDSDKVMVECVFHDPDVAFDLNADSEYRIAGRVQQFKSGSPIVLKEATVKEGQVGTTATPLDRPRANNSSNSFAAVPEFPADDLHTFCMHRSVFLNMGPIRTRFVHPARGKLLVSFTYAWSYS